MQSSWTKQAIKCESPEAASTEHPDSTCGFVIRPTIDSNDQEAQPGTGMQIQLNLNHLCYLKRFYYDKCLVFQMMEERVKRLQ